MPGAVGATLKVPTPPAGVFVLTDHAENVNKRSKSLKILKVFGYLAILSYLCSRKRRKRLNPEGLGATKQNATRWKEPLCCSSLAQ
jgi:hypothetical protein